MSDNLKFIGVDDGHYAIKVCAGKDKYFYTPARVIYGNRHIASFNGDYIEDNCYKIDNDVTLTVAESMILDGDVIDTRYISYPVSEVNAALVYHSLYKSNIKDKIAIVTSLPYSDFFANNGQKNSQLILNKENNLLNRIVCNTNTNVKLPKIIKHKVISEGIGGFFDLLYDFEGNQISEISDIIKKSSIAITDIGGKTTDIIQIALGGKGIVTDRSATVNIGMLDLINKITPAIKNNLTIDNVIPERIEQAISSGIYIARGQEFDVSSIISEQKNIFVRKIQNEQKKILKDSSEIGLHAFIGGGAISIENELKTLVDSRRYFVKEPEFANARGNWKAANFIMKWE